MDTLVFLLPLALMVERLVNVVKVYVTVPDSDRWVYGAIAWVLGIAASLALGLDLLTAFGHPIAIPLLGQVLTGLVVGGGSNVVSDVVGYVRAQQPASVSSDVRTA